MLLAPNLATCLPEEEGEPSHDCEEIRKEIFLLIVGFKG